MLRRLFTTLCLGLGLSASLPGGACLDVGDPLYITEPLAVSGIPEGGLEFGEHIEPLFDALGCLVCHAAGGGNANLDTTTVAGVLAGGDSGPSIIPCDSAGSLLYQRVEACEMPQFGPCMTPDELGTIAKWIDQGAGETFDESACPSPPFP